MRAAFFAALLILLCSARSAVGCAAVPLKLQRVSGDMTVLVTHRDSGIAGISVSVFPEGSSEPILSSVTDKNGTVLIPRMAAGSYCVTASHDGLEAGKQWVQVVPVRDLRAEKRLPFQWADWSYETSSVAGTLTGLVPGNTGNKLMDIVHPVETVHPGVDLTLKGAFSDDEYHTISDSSGAFLFGEVPDGIYVLTIPGGMKSVTGVADSTTLVIDVKRTSKRDSLLLQLRDTGCYRTEFELREK